MNTMRLPCLLTDEELLQRGQRVAELVENGERIEAERKESASGFKARLDRLGSEIAAISKELRSRREMREVEIAVNRDYRRRVIETVRMDTGEVVDTRAMTARELQMEIGEPRDRVNRYGSVSDEGPWSAVSDALAEAIRDIEAGRIDDVETARLLQLVAAAEKHGIDSDDRIVTVIMSELAHRRGPNGVDASPEKEITEGVRG